jgi:hypothetical protein
MSLYCSFDRGSSSERKARLLGHIVVNYVRDTIAQMAGQKREIDTEVNLLCLSPRWRNLNG